MIYQILEKEKSSKMLWKYNMTITKTAYFGYIRLAYKKSFGGHIFFKMFLWEIA